MTLYINGVETPIEPGHFCWGDLVGELDRGLAGAELVVTAVRIDGVDEPAFREPEVCSRLLSGIVTIDVQTGRAEALARQCLADAIRGLESLRDLSGLAARDFQTGDVESGRSNLEQVSQGLVTVLQIIAAAGIALRGELERKDDAGRNVGTLSATTDRAIVALVTAQQQEDWLQVADILEFELSPMIAQWEGFLSRIVASA